MKLKKISVLKLEDKSVAVIDRTVTRKDSKIIFFLPFLSALAGKTSARDAQPIKKALPIAPILISLSQIKLYYCTQFFRLY